MIRAGTYLLKTAIQTTACLYIYHLGISKSSLLGNAGNFACGSV